MKTVLKITAGILLAGTLMVAGCTAMIGAAANDPEVKKSVAQLEKASDDLDDMSGENDVKYRANMQQVTLGMTTDQVRGLLGKPRDTQVMRSDYGRNDTWYYGSWQLSFTDGVLDSKNRY